MMTSACVVPCLVFVFVEIKNKHTLTKKTTKKKQQKKQKKTNGRTSETAVYGETSEAKTLPLVELSLGL